MTVPTTMLISLIAAERRPRRPLPPAPAGPDHDRLPRPPTRPPRAGRGEPAHLRRRRDGGVVDLDPQLAEAPLGVGDGAADQLHAAVAAEQQLLGTQAAVVLEPHGMAVGTGVLDYQDVAINDRRQFALDSELVVVFAE